MKTTGAAAVFSSDGSLTQKQPRGEDRPGVRHPFGHVQMDSLAGGAFTTKTKLTKTAPLQQRIKKKNESSTSVLLMGFDWQGSTASTGAIRRPRHNLTGTTSFAAPTTMQPRPFQMVEARRKPTSGVICPLPNKSAACRPVPPSKSNKKAAESELGCPNNNNKSLNESRIRNQINVLSVPIVASSMPLMPQMSSKRNLKLTRQQQTYRPEWKKTIIQELRKGTTKSVATKTTTLTDGGILASLGSFPKQTNHRTTSKRATGPHCTTVAARLQRCAPTSQAVCSKTTTRMSRPWQKNRHDTQRQRGHALRLAYSVSERNRPQQQQQQQRMNPSKRPNLVHYKKSTTTKATTKRAVESVLFLAAASSEEEDNNSVNSLEDRSTSSKPPLKNECAYEDVIVGMASIALEMPDNFSIEEAVDDTMVIASSNYQGSTPLRQQIHPASQKERQSSRTFEKSPNEEKHKQILPHSPQFQSTNKTEDITNGFDKISLAVFPINRERIKQRSQQFSSNSNKRLVLPLSVSPAGNTRGDHCKRRDTKKTPAKGATCADSTEALNQKHYVTLDKSANDLVDSCSLSVVEVRCHSAQNGLADNSSVSSLSDCCATDQPTRKAIPVPKSSSLAPSILGTSNLIGASIPSCEHDHMTTTSPVLTKKTNRKISLPTYPQLDMLDKPAMPSAMKSKWPQRNRKVTDRFTIAAHTAGGFYKSKSPKSQFLPHQLPKTEWSVDSECVSKQFGLDSDISLHQSNDIGYSPCRENKDERANDLDHEDAAMMADDESSAHLPSPLRRKLPIPAMEATGTVQSNKSTPRSIRRSQRDRKKTDFFHNGGVPNDDDSQNQDSSSNECDDQEAEIANSDSIQPPNSEAPTLPCIVEQRQLRVLKPKSIYPKTHVVGNNAELDGWTTTQLNQLWTAYACVDPTSSSFWHDVASLVSGGKTAAECRLHWFSIAKTPSLKISKRITAAEHASMIDDDEDDIFNSTPMRISFLPSLNVVERNAHVMKVSVPANISETTEPIETIIKNFRPKPLSKAYLQRLRRDASRFEKENNRKKVRNCIPKRAKMLSEEVVDHDMDIKIRLSPGGTLKVHAQIDEEEDDFWSEMSDAENMIQ